MGLYPRIKLKPMRKSDNTQKTKIHIAKQELNLTDVEYDGLLAGYGVESSRDLSYSQAEELLAELKKRGWTPKPRKRKRKSTTPIPQKDKGWGKNKYEYLKPRPGYMAEPIQLRLVEVLWRIVARNPSDQALAEFVLRQTKIRKLEWLRKTHVRAVLCALQDMYSKIHVAQIRERESLLKEWQREMLKSNLNDIINMG